MIGQRRRPYDLSIVQHGRRFQGRTCLKTICLFRIAEFGGHVFRDGDVEALVCAVMPIRSHRWLVGCDSMAMVGLRRSGDGGDLNLAATGQTG